LVIYILCPEFVDSINLSILAMSTETTKTSGKARQTTPQIIPIPTADDASTTTCMLLMGFEPK
jgi:hypothetical protein